VKRGQWGLNLQKVQIQKSMLPGTRHGEPGVFLVFIEAKSKSEADSKAKAIKKAVDDLRKNHPAWKSGC
jgi:hypothetical protein